MAAALALMEFSARLKLDLVTSWSSCSTIVRGQFQMKKLVGLAGR